MNALKRILLSAMVMAGVTASADTWTAVGQGSMTEPCFSYIFDKASNIYGINSEKVMNKYKSCKYENYIKHTKPTTYNHILFFMANGHIFYRKVCCHFIMCGSSERRAM